MMSKSATTTEAPDLLRNPTPGDILMAEFLAPLALSQTALARAIGVPPRRINEIVLGKRAVTADTDLRLARYYGISEGIFLGLQMDYDLRMQRRALGKKMDAIKQTIFAANSDTFIKFCFCSRFGFSNHD